MLRLSLRTCVLALALSLHVNAVLGQRCASAAEHIPCGTYSGLQYRVNDGRIHQTDNLSDWRALMVPHGMTLSMSLCNYGNLEVDDVTLRNVSVVPSLVSSVERDATVRIHIYNSANLAVSERLVIGYTLSEREELDFEANDTAIVDKVVRGPVGDGAQILVDVDRTANVYLRAGTRDLRLGKATLLNELINGPHEQNMHCLAHTCLETRVAHSANVRAEEPGKSDVFIQDGQLDDESVDTGCIGKGSFVRVAKRNVSNVHGVRTLDVWDGELSDEAVDALHIRDATVEVAIHDSANVWADHVRINEGELVDEMVDARDLKNASISVLATNMANVDARSVEILEGELVDESVDVRDIRDTKITITLTDVANVRVSKLLSIIEGQLVDELLDANTLTHGAVDISLQRVASVLCGGGAVTLSHSELLETLIDAADVSGTKAALSVEDSGNVHVREDWLQLMNSKLAKEPYDVDLTHTQVKYSHTRSGRNMCARCAGSSSMCAEKKRHWTFYKPVSN